VLAWDQYQKLLDEIGALIAGDEEGGAINGSPEYRVLGIPPSTTDSPKEVKILRKSPPS